MPASGENPTRLPHPGEKRAAATRPSSGDEPGPISPAEAATKIDKEVTVQMEVKSATLRDGTCYLNSEEDFKDDKNFTLYLDRDALDKFGKARIEDPAAHFRGKTIRVTGRVTLYRNRPQIKVTGPNMIQVVE
jgi:DNA/RNA endonuclease YhcR with UshA esterase domain